MNLYVANINFKATEYELRRKFQQFGTVNSVKILKDRETGKPRGIGFVEMSNKTEGENAIAGLNDYEFQGRKLTVRVANDRK